MLIVGLTGGIASGKSTASYLISSHPAHIPIIDLDILAREVVAPGQPTLSSLRTAFGPSVISPDGTLNRPELGRIAFATPEKTKLLNKITHGAIRRLMIKKLIGYWLTGQKVVVVDTPLLVEAGLWKYCGELVLVYCKREDQLKRMLKRDADKGLTEEDAQQRLKAQLPLDDKLAYADAVLDNSSSITERIEGQDAPEWTQRLDRETSLALRIQVDRLVARWVDGYSGVGGRVRWLLQWLVPPVGVVMGMWRAWMRTRGVKERLARARAGPSSKL